MTEAAEKYAVSLNVDEDAFETPEFEKQMGWLSDYLKNLTGEEPAHGDKKNIRITNLDQKQVDKVLERGDLQVEKYAAYLGHDYFPDAHNRKPKDGEPIGGEPEDV